MKTLSKLVSTSSVSLLVITSPVLISNNHKTVDLFTSTTATASTYHIPVVTNKAIKHISYTSPVADRVLSEKITAAVVADKNLD